MDFYSYDIVGRRVYPDAPSQLDRECPAETVRPPIHVFDQRTFTAWDQAHEVDKQDVAFFALAEACRGKFVVLAVGWQQECQRLGRQRIRVCATGMVGLIFIA